MDAQQPRNTVISVRVGDMSLQAIDLLVQSGLVQSRSEAVAQFVSIGIRSADDLLEKARELADNVQRVRGKMMARLCSTGTPPWFAHRPKMATPLC